MNEPTMETLARRLDQVERENRCLKQAGAVALAVIAAVVLMGQTTGSKVAKVVEAEKFVLRDTNRKPRAVLDVAADGGVALVLAGTSPKPGVTLGVEPDGSSVLAFSGKDAKRRAAMATTINGVAGLVLYDRDARERAAVIVEPDGTPYLQLYDRDGKVIWGAP